MEGVIEVRRLPVVLFSFVLVAIPLGQVLAGSSSAQGGAKKDVILRPADITPKIFPETVFYRGRAASAQMRNTGGVQTRALTSPKYERGRRQCTVV